MYCEKCGYKLRRGVKSCAQCGAPTPYNHSRSAVMIILAVLLTIAGVAAVLILDKEQAIPVLIVDVATVAAILIGLFVGVKRGFLYGTVSTILLAAVFVVSIFASQTLTPIIYDGIISPEIVSVVDDTVADSSSSQEMVDAIVGDDENPGYVDIDSLIELLNSELLSVADEEELSAFMNTEFETDSDRVSSYLSLLGLEETENNCNCVSYYLREDRELVGDGYDYRKIFAYSLAESWMENCLPAYKSFWNLCNQVAKKLGDSNLSSEIREAVESRVLGILIGNTAITSDNILGCVETITGESSSGAVNQIIWAYLTGGKVGVLVESELFRPLIVYCLEILLFLIFVLLLRFIMSLIMKIFRVLENVHMPYALDLIFGTVEGIASGAVWLCYAAVVVGIVIIGIMIFGGGDIVTTIEDTITNTHVFKYFYQLFEHISI
ncbi:MAG: zinc ribbon domain-containing protein [Oscillospiraceae bacterium]|nr:zinc ribbon domain-containing protein [Oscillospiraceae bacterium]